MASGLESYSKSADSWMLVGGPEVEAAGGDFEQSGAGVDERFLVPWVNGPNVRHAKCDIVLDLLRDLGFGVLRGEDVDANERRGGRSPGCSW